MIGQNPKAEVALFSSAEIGIKNISFEDRCRREQRVNLMQKLRAKKQNRGFRTVVDVIRCIETAAEIPGEKRKESWTREDNRRLQSKLYKTPLSRKRENTLWRIPS